MEQDYLPLIEQSLIGRSCEIVRREADWAINLKGGGSISLPVPWRIVQDGRIAFADTDDGQWFGLPAPVDGEATANLILSQLPISDVSINRETADLTLYFGQGVRLDTFSNSSGYEGWQISVSLDSKSLTVVALGGGEFAIY